MAEDEKARGAEGGIMDLPGGTAGSSGEIPFSGETSAKSVRSSIINTTVTTNVMIGDSKRSFVIVQRDDISIAEKGTQDVCTDPIRSIPPRMSEWTRDDVRIWLKDCPAIRELQAEQFAEKVANGNSLISYNEVNLQRDLGFTEKEVECFVISRNAWLSKENENKDHAFSRVSKIGGTSTSSLQLTAMYKYNIMMSNCTDCIVLIAGGNRPRSDDRPFIDIPVNLHVRPDPVDSTRQRLTYDVIFLFIKRAAQDFGIKGIKEIVKTIEDGGHCSVKGVERSSIRFIVRFYSKESLDKFNERCLNGELAGKLTAHLITDDNIRKVSENELSILLFIEDTDYKEALRILHPKDLSSEATSKKLAEDDKWAYGLRSLKKLKRLKLKHFSLNGDGMNKVAKSLMQLTDFVELDVSGNPLGGSKRKWSSYLKTMTNLNKIDFSACDLTGGDAKSIALRSRDKLRLQVNLSGNKELGGSTDKWVEQFHPIEYLNQLVLSDCNVKGSNVGQIISNLRNVEELDLSSNELGGSLELWTPALKKLDKLTKLVLRSCGLTAEGLKNIDDNLEQNKEFYELDVSGNHGIGSSMVSASLPKNPKKLDISDCCLNGETFNQDVTDYLSLVDINLSKNKDIVTPALSTIIRKLAKLEKLSLSGCSLTGKFMEDILCACLQLITLDISDNEGLRGTLSLWVEKVKEMENLQSFSLGSCNLTGEDVRQVLTNLKDANNLKGLTLSGNREIGKDHRTISLVADMNNLNTLELSDCMLQQCHMKELLQRKLRLVELIISKNDGLKGTLFKWAESLLHLEDLCKLDFGFSSLEEADFKDLSEELKKMPKFSELCIAGNADIGKSEDCWYILGTMKLKKLDISHCSLAEDGMERILELQGKLGDQGQLEELDMSFHPDLGKALISPVPAT